MRIVCGAGPSAHLDADRIDCVEQLSSVWGHSSLRKLRGYCVYKCRGKVSKDVWGYSLNWQVESSVQGCGDDS